VLKVRYSVCDFIGLTSERGKWRIGAFSRVVRLYLRELFSLSAALKTNAPRV